MESFLDTHNHRPVQHIDIAEGETKIIGIKRFNYNTVKVSTLDPEIAFSAQCVHLKDVTKHKYNDWSAMSAFNDEVVEVAQHGLLFFQICGKSVGQTELAAKFVNLGANAEYATPVSIVVKANKKHLTLAPAKGFPPPTFRLLWANHPMRTYPGHPAVHYPCGGDPAKSPLGKMQCMVRLCTALEQSGVSFVGVHSPNGCKLPGSDHAHHFSNPYDFELWHPSKNSHYTWEARPPLQPEPMPGIAASQFMYKRHGIVLFWNYFDIKGSSSMFGGHIDLWNEARMGNTYDYKNPWEGEAAFYRARKIAFWPLD